MLSAAAASLLGKNGSRLLASKAGLLQWAAAASVTQSPVQHLKFSSSSSSSSGNGPGLCFTSDCGCGSQASCCSFGQLVLPGATSAVMYMCGQYKYCLSQPSCLACYMTCMPTNFVCLHLDNTQLCNPAASLKQFVRVVRCHSAGMVVGEGKGVSYPSTVPALCSLPHTCNYCPGWTSASHNANCIIAAATLGMHSIGAAAAIIVFESTLDAGQGPAWTFQQYSAPFYMPADHFNVTGHSMHCCMLHGKLMCAAVLCCTLSPILQCTWCLEQLAASVLLLLAGWHSQAQVALVGASCCQSPVESSADLAVWAMQADSVKECLFILCACGCFPPCNLRMPCIWHCTHELQRGAQPGAYGQETFPF